ncbi:MAG: macro domain-containing protein [Nitrospirae bacterium]|nr:macro domain-containing protein [Candidatus Manganitrophaceae bacterium]
MKRVLSGVTVECIKGNIAAQPDVAAIVNAANAELTMGGGVAGAIHRAAGPGLAEEGRPLAPIRPGEAVITGGHRLPNRYVIHCLGPVYGRDKPEAALLARCYSRALDLAEAHQIAAIAFPAISTGIFGYPMKAAAEVAFRTIQEKIPTLQSVQQIRFVLFSDPDLDIHEKALSIISGE